MINDEKQKKLQKDLLDLNRDNLRYLGYAKETATKTRLMSK